MRRSAEAGLAARARRALEASMAAAQGLRQPLADGSPGALVRLERGAPALIVPDVHARPGLLRALCGLAPEPGGRSLGRMLEREEAYLVFLGDMPHSEGPGAAERWARALREYLGGWENHDAMDEEMRLFHEAYRALFDLVEGYPGRVVVLKGNHDNVRNREGLGDHPFRKFALEGEMTLSWLRASGMDEDLEALAAWEDGLPLLCAGGSFLASHAEPRRAYSADELICGRRLPEVAEGLTWTDNGEAEEGSVAAMLSSLLGPEASGARYIGGHRPARGGLQRRQGGLFLQIHDPFANQCLWADPRGKEAFFRILRAQEG